MHVGAAHYRKHIDVDSTHALERQVKGLVGVYVRKILRVEEFRQPLRCTASREGLLQRVKINDSGHASAVRHWPGAGVTGACLFERLLYGHP